MSDLIAFTIPGVPVAQGRPKFTTVAGRSRAYDPEKSRNWKAYVRLLAGQHAPREPWTGPVALTLSVHLPIPKWSAKRRSVVPSKFHAKRPDLDNLVKGVKDALSGVVWCDDGQVAVMYARKVYAEQPRCEVEVERLPGLPWEKTNG